MKRCKVRFTFLRSQKNTELPGLFHFKPIKCDPFPGCFPRYSMRSHKKDLIKAYTAKKDLIKE